ncbi:MAG: dehydrogenase, partial [Limnothrix sp. RL_2_0]|nr:dehydrogenase [Limnothrix sp. RL_2_0]
GAHPYAMMPISVVAHQCGTCKFGDDASSSVLNLDCRAHDVENLYVVDSSFFPSSSATSPMLTVIANALRVGDRLIEKLP